MKSTVLMGSITYDDTWSDPNQITTIEGTGYYPQATRNFLWGLTLKF